MPLTFAIGMFFAAMLGETFRLGWIPATPLLAAMTVSAALILVAGLILGRDAKALIRPSGNLYGGRGTGWTWRRSALLLLSVPLLWLLPVAGGAGVTEFFLHVPKPAKLVSALVVQILVIALAEELFFRESVLKVLGGRLPLCFAATAAATALYTLPQGAPAAAMAAGGALAYMALRVSGMNLLVVAAVHGVTNVLLGRVLVAQLAPDSLWIYCLAVAAGYAVFATALMSLRQPRPALAAAPRRKGALA